MTIALLPARFQYMQALAATIATTPTWTLIGTLVRPGRSIDITSTVNSDVEISFDGVNIAAFLENGSSVIAETRVGSNLAAAGVALPTGTRIFARKSVAGVAGRLSITITGSDA